jgi:hypothetical protein
MNPVPPVVDHAKRSVIETIKSKSPFSVLNIAAILAILNIGYFLYKKFNKKFNREGTKMPKRPMMPQMPMQMPQMPMQMPMQMPQQPQVPVKKVSFKKPPVVKVPEPEPIVEEDDEDEEEEADVPDVEVTEE